MHTAGCSQQQCVTVHTGNDPNVYRLYNGYTSPEMSNIRSTSEVNESQEHSVTWMSLKSVTVRRRCFQAGEGSGDRPALPSKMIAKLGKMQNHLLEAAKTASKDREGTTLVEAPGR